MAMLRCCDIDGAKFFMSGVGSAMTSVELFTGGLVRDGGVSGMMVVEEG